VPTRVALATCAEFPDLDEDGPVLLDALASRGRDAEAVVWTDPEVDWASYGVVVVHSTWDYAPRRDDFVAWARRVEAVTHLANPAAVLEWNTDKTYLRALTDAGLPVVATDWLEPGDTFTPPEYGDYVVKPTVSAGSKDTNRYLGGEHDDLAIAHVGGLLAAGRTVMVQPYLSEVDTYGETALLFLGGTFSHAIRKGPLLTPAMEFVTAAYAEETIDPRGASDSEREVAERVLDVLPTVGPARRQDLAYARIDLVRGSSGDPTLLELELVEPSLFLLYDGADGAVAADRLAAAIVAAGG
jgi:hypothetical protein